MSNLTIRNLLLLTLTFGPGSIYAQDSSNQNGNNAPQIDNSPSVEFPSNNVASPGPGQPVNVAPTTDANGVPGASINYNTDPLPGSVVTDPSQTVPQVPLGGSNMSSAPVSPPPPDSTAPQAPVGAEMTPPPTESQAPISVPAPVSAPGGAPADAGAAAPATPGGAGEGN